MRKIHMNIILFLHWNLPLSLIIYYTVQGLDKRKIYFLGSSLYALNPAVRFALPELELGTVLEEETEDMDYRRQKKKKQPKLKKISRISRNMFKVLIAMVFNGF